MTRSASLGRAEPERPPAPPTTSVLSHAGRLLASTVDDDAMLGIVARLALPELADLCLVSIRDEATGSIRVELARADLPGGFVDEVREVERSSAPRETLNGFSRAARGGQILHDLPESLLDELAAEPADRVRLRREVRSALVVPMVARGRGLGTILLAYTGSGRRYEADDLETAEALAMLAATAIENGRLFRAEQHAREAAERAAARTARLQAITAALADAFTSGAVADVVMEQATAAVGADAGAIVLLDEASKELHVLRAAGYDVEMIRRFERFPLAMRVPLAESVRSGAPIFLESAAEVTERFPAMPVVPGRSAWAVLPLRVKGRRLGAMGLTFDAPRRFTEPDRQFLSAVSQQCAQALERARLHETEEATRARADAAGRRLEFLAQASVALTASFEPFEILQELARLAVPTIADWITVDLVDEDGSGMIERVLVYHADPVRAEEARIRSVPPRHGGTAGSGRVVATGQPEMVADLTPEAIASLIDDAEAGQLANRFEIRSYMAVPLEVRGRIIGALTFATAESARRYDEEDLATAVELGRRVASAIDNARLLQAERAAQRSREETSALVDAMFGAAPVGLAFWDPDLRFVRVNDALAEMTGISPEAHIGRSLGELLPDLNASLEETMRGVLRARAPVDSVQVSGRTPASLETRTWLASFFPVSLADPIPPVGLGAVITEITERRRSELEREQLVRELQQFKLTLDTTSDSVVMFWPDSLRFFYANRGAIESSGYPLAELLTLRPLDLEPDHEEPRFRGALVPLLERPGESRTFVTSWRRRDGSTFPVELSLQFVAPHGEAGRVIAIARDITDRVEARTRLQRLAQSERARNAELNAIIQAMGDGVLVLDAAGNVVFSNPASDAILNRPIRRFEDVLSALYDPDGQAPRPGLAVAQEPVELGVAGSPEQWLELSAYPVFTPSEMVGDGRDPSDRIETIVFIRDVTEVRRTQLARDAFMGVLSHELRTPVTTIFGNSKLLARGTALPPDATLEVHRDIEVESERLYRLVEDLLVLARYGEGASSGVATEPILLQRIAPPVIRAEAARWTSTRFEVDLPPTLPAVEGDPTYVEQVIRNLVSNAAKYGSTDQRVVSVKLEEVDEGVTVRVLDEGPGFEEGEAERLFDLFYRSQRAQSTASGAGIGLFVCRRLVEAMGGRIWARPRPSGGAEFGFVLRLFLEDDL